MPTYRLQKHIDMALTYPEIRQLEALGFDWVHETMQVLLEKLTLDIGSAWILQGESDAADAVDGVHEVDYMTYGNTQCFDNGPDTKISMVIAGDIIWPLLSPHFSESEKMTCSFSIASTLIHELAVSHPPLFFSFLYFSPPPFFFKNPSPPQRTID